MQHDACDDLWADGAHAPWMRTLARRLCREWEDPDDLVQDAWLHAKISPTARTEPRRWLAAVLRNRQRMDRRARIRREARERAAVTEPGREPPDSLLLARELRQVLVEALSTLQAADAGLLRDHFLEERTARDIAQQYSVPASTIRSRIERALKRLRTEMEARLGSGEGPWMARLGLVYVAPASGYGSSALPWGLAVAMKKGLAALAVAMLVIAATWFLVDDGRSRASGVTRGSVAAPNARAARGIDSIATGTYESASNDHERMRQAIRNAIAVDDEAERIDTDNATAEHLADALQQAMTPPGLGQILGPLTATIQSGLASCIEDLADGHGGQLHFGVELIGAPDVGTILDSVESRSKHPNAELVACAEASLLTSQFSAPSDTLMREMVITMNISSAKVEVGLPVSAQSVVPLLQRYPVLTHGSENVASLLQFEGVRQALRGALINDPQALTSYPELRAALERASD